MLYGMTEAGGGRLGAGRIVHSSQICFLAGSGFSL